MLSTNNEARKLSWAEQTVYEIFIASQRIQVFHTSAASEYISVYRYMYGGNGGIQKTG